MNAEKTETAAPEFRLSRRARGVGESVTLALGARAKAMKAEGIDAIDLGAGQPDFPTPEAVRRRAQADIEAGLTGYTATAGMPELRRAICAKLLRDSGLDYSPDRVVVTIGAKQAVYNAIEALIDVGDEVIIPAPYWVSYPEMVKLAGGKPVFLHAGADADYKIAPEQLAAAVTPRTAMLIFNSPSNPTGMVYSEAEIRALAAALESHPRVVVLSDEIYEKLIYDGARHFSFAAASPAIEARTLTVNGMSKAYAMTGWRIGYCAGPRPIVAAMERLQSHSTSNATSFCQSASVTALTEVEEEVERMRRAFDERRKVMLGRLRALPGVRCPEARGAFYLFPDASELMRRAGIGGSMELCERWLKELRVNAIPGAACGDDRSIRLSYATSMEQIEKAMDRIEAFARPLA